MPGLESYITFLIWLFCRLVPGASHPSVLAEGRVGLADHVLFLHLEVVRKFILELHRGLCETKQTFTMFAKSAAQRVLQVFLLSLLNLARATFSLNSCSTLNFLFTRNS